MKVSGLANGAVTHQLSSDEIRQAKDMIEEATLDCIVKDIRPIRFTEGEGVKSLIK